jgi:dTDP-glucose 4,6-dehydratase
MRILVTGGAGFLGSHLCDALVERGDEVVCVDDLSTGLRSNLAQLWPDGRFEFVEADVCAGLDIGGHFDAVAHLASAASPPAYLRRPIETLSANSVGTQNALQLALRHNARFLLASTSEVYGDPMVHPQHEGYFGNVNPVGPRSVYNEAKRYAETITMAYKRHYGLNSGIVRIFNTYGPRMDAGDGRVVSSLISQALRNAPLTINGDGTQTRSFCYVNDLVQGLVTMLKSDHAGPVNLGNPHEVRVIDLARLIQEVTGSSSVLEFKQMPADDPVRRKPVIDRARTLLGWKPTVDLESGVRATVDWLRTRQAAVSQPAA